MKLGQPDPRSGHQWTLSEPRQPDELFEPGTNGAAGCVLCGKWTPGYRDPNDALGFCAKSREVHGLAVSWDGREVEMTTRAAFIEANAADPFICAAVLGLKHGQSVTLGGGAAPMLVVVAL